MTIERMDKVGIVVEDLDAAIAFFTELGMEREVNAQIEGLWADRTVGLQHAGAASRHVRRRRHSRTSLPACALTARSSWVSSRAPYLGPLRPGFEATARAAPRGLHIPRSFPRYVLFPPRKPAATSAPGVKASSHNVGKRREQYGGPSRCAPADALITSRPDHRSTEESDMLTKFKRALAGAAVIAVAGSSSAAYAAPPTRNTGNHSPITVIKTGDSSSPH
jgi:catechol 2,3-dioxygenase-like lactoylglutathione lyase family enzyme